jgi:hypothetical protein
MQIKKAIKTWDCLFIFKKKKKKKSFKMKLFLKYYF